MPSSEDPQEAGERLPRFRKDPSEEAWFLALNLALASLDLPDPTVPTDPARLPLVYIVGVPRSGTTLASQLVSRHLVVGWIGGLVARFWARPSVGIRLARALDPDYGRAAISYRSLHGYTGGFAGPHEFGYFWRHWLGLDTLPNHRLDADALARVDRHGLRRALEEEILSNFAMPVVMKNLIAGLQARCLAEIHPASLFLRLRRPREETVRSILRARIERYGDPAVWWSLKPSTFPFPDLGRDPAADVVRQVDDLEADLDAELSWPGIRVLEVEHQAMLEDPSAMLVGLQAGLACMGAPVAAVASAPPAFSPPTPTPLPPWLEVAVERALTASGPGPA